MRTTSDFSLEAKYRQAEGRILLSGIQALVRLPLDQHRADRQRGMNTATLVSGYRGSPLGGLDITLQRNQALLQEHQVVFMPGVNEDLSATAIYGSQLVNRFPQPKYDGVLGMWYGKAPGVDRSGDIFKHANFAGVGRHGGVLAVAGDDPTAKSSTLPSHSEVAFYDALMPVLYSGNVQEILDYGRLGFELSRFSGLWVGFKIATNVADAFETAEVAQDRVVISDPGFTFNGRPWQPTQDPTLLAPNSLALEREIYEGRLEAAKAFASANSLNRITVPTSAAWLGIVAAGKTYYDVRQALDELGLDEAALHRYGIRLLKVGMLFPLEPDIIHTFARGLEEILVVEEKRAFIELFIRDVLYNQSERPRVVGKRDEHGETLVRPDGELDSDQVAQIVAVRVAKRVPLDSISARISLLKAVRERPNLPFVPRAAYFCSGCPHNRSTVVPEGSIAGAGIGCHGLALVMDRDAVSITQMGGEGMPWVGMAPFTEIPHMFQNVGDGTLFHSGSLAIRQAVAAGTNITYKILYNSAVAMTGGQHADGALSVPDLTRALDAEGVKHILVLADETGKYPADARWAEGVEVWHRERLDEAQRKLRETPGVTVLIYDQYCAAELRRMRKRGQRPEPTTRVFINEAVCEGCGDCGVKSNCLSVYPVETEFGRKTQIHQSSCNMDYTCLSGDCPAFLTVETTAVAQPKARQQNEVPVDLPEPVRTVNGACNLYLMGIGGTGVVTASQVLGTAALLDGKYVRTLDQTGMSQKGGAVVSHIKISDQAPQGSSQVATGEANCYLAFDILTAATPHNLSRARPDKTIAVVSSSQVPTGAMVRSTEIQFPHASGLIDTIEAHTRKDENVYLDAVGLAETLFGSHMPANIIVLGAAYQAGALPVSAQAVEHAIVLNGVAVEVNQQAFRVGRRLVADPEWAQTLKHDRPGALDTTPVVTPEARALIDQVGATGELLRLLEFRVPELIAYQNVSYAGDYVAFVQRVVAAERAAVPGETRLSEAVARYLFKLMAYKDEYEVARLHLLPAATRALADQFGLGARVQYHIHPPFLRALGWQQKIRFGKWFDLVFHLLVRLRGLRGTALDLFGYTQVRRTERALIREYRALIEQMLVDLSPENYERAFKLANLPDMIRGYEDIKLRNIQRFWDEVEKLRGGTT